MSELAVRDAYQPDRVIQRSGGVYERDVIDGWVQVMSDVAKLADYISETDFVPKSLRNKPAAIAACILTGRELGIGPMQSLKSIYMVQGVPSLSAEYKRARALAAGHEISIDDTNSTRCVIRGRRANTERWVTITWTMDMAKRAKLAGKDIWQAYPQRMLQARASGELCDLLFPDASLGLATTEVLEDGGIVALESGEMVDAATGELTTGTAAAIEPARPRTAQRRTRQAADRPTGAAPAAASGAASGSAAPASGPTAPSGDGLPRLPGEEDEAPDGAMNGNGGTDGDPNAPLPAADPEGGANDIPGSVTGDQIKAVWTVLSKEFGFKSDDGDKEAARVACGVIIGRDITSTKHLSLNEARTILDTLGHVRQQAAAGGGEPRDWLMDLLQRTEEARDGQVHGGQQ